MANPWTIIGYALIAGNLLVLAALLRPLRFHRLARAIESTDAPRVAIAQLTLFLLLATLLSLGHVETRSSDPRIYLDATNRMLAGENPYEASPGEDAPAYTWIFLAPFGPLAPALGLAGIHIGVALAALPLPFLVHRCTTILAGPRAAAYAACLTILSPYALFGAARWAMDEVYVALAILVALHGFLTQRSLRALAIAGMLAIKTTALIPLGAWVLQTARDPPRWRRLVYWAAPLAASVLFVLLVGALEYGEPYLQNLYLKTSVDRLQQVRASANLFVLLELAGRTAPTWLQILLGLALAAAVIGAMRHPTTERLAPAIHVLAALLLLLPSMNTDFVAWLLPLLAIAGARPRDGPMFAVLYVMLVGFALAHDIARYTLDGPVRAIGLIVTAVGVTTCLAVCIAKTVPRPT